MQWLPGSEQCSVTPASRYCSADSPDPSHGVRFASTGRSRLVATRRSALQIALSRALCRSPEVPVAAGAERDGLSQASTPETANLLLSCGTRVRAAVCEGFAKPPFSSAACKIGNGLNTEDLLTGVLRGGVCEPGSGVGHNSSEEESCHLQGPSSTLWPVHVPQLSLDS